MSKYNETIKEKYIHFTENTSKTASSVKCCLKKVLKYEGKYNKDASDFSEEEILEMYVIIGFTNLAQMQNFNSQLSKYTDFCIKERGEGQNFYKNITSEKMLKRVDIKRLNNKVLTREELLDIIKDNFCTFKNYEEKIFALGLFEGIREEDFTELYPEDLKGKVLKLRKTGRVITISDELASLMRINKNTYNYIRDVGSKLHGSIEIISTYDKNDRRIIKNRDHPKGKLTEWRIRHMVSKFQSNIHPGMSAKNLNESGRINEINKFIKNSEKIVTYKELVKFNNSEKMVNKYGKVNSNLAYFTQYRSCITGDVDWEKIGKEIAG